MGTFAGMPARIPLEETELRDGVRRYKPKELVARKLQTIIGVSPRVLPRDVYDTGWIATMHPELITRTDAQKLKDWLQGTIERGAVDDIKAKLKKDAVTRRVDADTVWNKVEEGISKLDSGPERDNERGTGRNEPTQHLSRAGATNTRNATREAMRPHSHEPLTADKGPDAKKSDDRDRTRDEQARNLAKAFKASTTPERRGRGRR